MAFQPGSLVRARGREWVVLPESDQHNGLLWLRPFGGADGDAVPVLASLEVEPVKHAQFSPPTPAMAGAHDAARLLYEASVLKLRSGAGPFRSFGNVAVEPRAYQLVPLMMGLKQRTVRLLIADDVGVGKTIEAGLLVKELLARGEISRFVVLCPPTLVDQWVSELSSRFNIQADALTASSAARLERNAPQSALFDHYPFVVASLDYLKSDKHRENFLHMAPECVVVDEAHTCTMGVRTRQHKRFELLQKIAADENRHMILLTATPHSGDDEAFHNLLSLLRSDFAQLKQLRADPAMDEADAERAADAWRRLRGQLALYFVQRRRKDIEEWKDQNLFPTRMTTEITYRLSGEWEAFFEDVCAYCAAFAERAESEKGRGARLIWFVTLSLLRCVTSSPAAAEKALSTKLAGLAEAGAAENDGETDSVFDGRVDGLALSDLEPSAGTDDAKLENLIAKAHALASRGASSANTASSDPKLAALTRGLRGLLKDGFHPVVFCRYIETAKYVAGALSALFPDVTVEAVTGDLPPEERVERTEHLGEFEHRILVATDCLSEGINLQESFDAVIHYDLAWNPTRHEQREGRVDRFGQRAKEVRCIMLYGENNPVDGLILKVILRKAETIRSELGISVPMPDNGEKLQEVLKTAILSGLSRKKTSKDVQMSLDFGDSWVPDAQDMEEQWQNALEKMKANRTVFAQRSLKPENVLPEWRREQQALGSEEDVKKFVSGALGRLGAPLEETSRPKVYRINLAGLPQPLVERLHEHRVISSDSKKRPTLVCFQNPSQLDAVYVHRSHPLVTLLADELLEAALSGTPRPPAARCAVTVTRDVERLTRVYLLRLRHQLVMTRRTHAAGQRQEKRHVMMAEETLTVVLDETGAPTIPQSAALLEVTPSKNAAHPESYLQDALTLWESSSARAQIDALAAARAEKLRADHIRVKDAASDTGTYEVTPCLPADLLGVYVLLPDLEDM
ncbi:MAG: DEAD/DEAH box helicase [Synergistaceae bacterium]|jgi:superfamily II DNA or RNA helicase|nr:DEAD/DEAH box helicase [Synergistaceae bacterium]